MSIMCAPPDMSNPLQTFSKVGGVLVRVLDDFDTFIPVVVLDIAAQGVQVADNGVWNASRSTILSRFFVFE